MSDGWEWREAGLWVLPALEADGGARAAFSSRLGGTSAGRFHSLNLGLSVGDDPLLVRANRQLFAERAGFSEADVASVDQVHGARVLCATAPGGGGTADALCTAAPGLVLTVGVADCAAVFLVDPRGPAVGLCHAGWRGTAAGVAPAAVETMRTAFGSRPGDLLAAVSPCIGPCCYEVDTPVIAAFAEREARLLAVDAGHARLDLGETNRLQLLAAGLRPERIWVAGICTACQRETLFSHRRDGGRTGRMRAALWLPAMR